ncbi:MAG: Holliday junction resolvase RuvX [Bacteroidia bacterium]
MARILALDYGGKRTGIASTDPMQLIASPLQTVNTNELLQFFKTYTRTEEVEALVVGQPTRYDGSFSPIEERILEFITDFEKTFPEIKVFRINEMFTSKEAMQALIKSGVKKKQRRDKKLLDSTSATLILQEFLAQQ